MSRSGGNTSSVPTAADLRKVLLFDALRVIKVQPENVTEIFQIDNLHKSLCEFTVKK